MLTPWLKANVKNLNSFGIKTSEIDSSRRRIQSASPEKTALLQIHTDSSMKLRIRLLEDAPGSAGTERKLLQEMHIWRRKENPLQNKCGDKRLSLTRDGMLTFQTNVNDVVNVMTAFVHKYRVFYVNEYFENHFEILTDDGIFLTSLPTYFKKYWYAGNYMSYDDKLLFVPFSFYHAYQEFNAVLISEDFFRQYQIIPSSRIVSEERFLTMQNLTDEDLDMSPQKGDPVYISMFQNEVLAITPWAAQFYDGQAWKDLEMQWAGLREIWSENINFMVVHTKNADHLFAFAGPAGR